MAGDKMVFEPDQFVAIFSAAARDLSNHYGCIQALEEDGRVADKATVTFVELDGRRVLLTNKHVVTGLSKLELPCVVSVAQLDLAGRPVDRKAADPVVFRIDISRTIWSWDEMDVAALPATEEMLKAREPRWFDANRGAEVATTTRKLWRRLNELPEKGSLPLGIFGFPKFGHVVLPQERIEILSALPVPAYITELDEEPWQALTGTGRAPKMHLEIDAREPTIPASDLSEFEKIVFAKLFKEPLATSPAFGGYSGGPVVLVAKDGPFLVGITREGGLLFGEPRALAACLDDVVSALRRAAK
jgi:hypothetical protein